MTRPRPADVRPHVGRSLQFKVRVYLAILVVAAATVILHCSQIGRASALPVAVGAGLGMVVGAGASRMQILSWDRVSSTVIGRVDAVGAMVLLGYVAFVVLRNSLLGTWFDVQLVGVAGVATLVGLMAGQIVGTGRGIVRVMRLMASHSRSAVHGKE